MTGSGALLAGHDTARLSPDQRAATLRAVTAAKATRFLTRTGNADLIAVLGLAPPPPRPPMPSATSRTRPQRDCPVCGEPFRPCNAKQKTCSRACGHRTGWHTQPDPTEATT